MISIRQILCAGLIFLLYACSGGSSSFEFNSAKTYARIDKDLKEAEKWGLQALEMEPNNALIPYFLAVEVYRPMKKQSKVAAMYIEALSRNENLVLDRPFKSGDEYINNVHEAIKLEGINEFNQGVELFGKNKKNKAISKFELATKLVPNFIEPYITLSTIAMVDEDYEKALTYINEGLKIKSSNELNTRKAECLAKQGNYEQAINLLNLIQTEDELMKINIDRQVFNIMIEQEDYVTGSILGNTLVEKMFITLGIDETEIARTCYNVAFCNYQIGSKKHEKALAMLNSGTLDAQGQSDALTLAEDAVKYYQEAKGRFYDSSSYNPNDVNSSNKAKELNKSIKQIKEIIIPGLKK